MTFETYKDRRGEWRWRVRAANHRIVAVSSEGYKNRKDMLAGAAICRDTLSGAHLADSVECDG